MTRVSLHNRQVLVQLSEACTMAECFSTYFCRSAAHPGFV
jgi:hypothetical protein